MKNYAIGLVHGFAIAVAIYLFTACDNPISSKATDDRDPPADTTKPAVIPFPPKEGLKKCMHFRFNDIAYNNI